MRGATGESTSPYSIAMNVASVSRPILNFMRQNAEDESIIDPV
jgi:hypothetical protein